MNTDPGWEGGPTYPDSPGTPPPPNDDGIYAPEQGEIPVYLGESDVPQEGSEDE